AANGLQLIFRVKEKPTVSAVIFKGNDEIDDSELQDTSDIKPFEILDMNKVRSSIDKIVKMYEEKGFFLAKVDHEVKEGEDGSAELIFNIVENSKVKVAQIRFLGNRAIPSTRLKSAMQTQEGGFFSFMS